MLAPWIGWIRIRPLAGSAKHTDNTTNVSEADWVLGNEDSGHCGGLSVAGGYCPIAREIGRRACRSWGETAVFDEDKTSETNRQLVILLDVHSLKTNSVFKRLPKM